MKNIYEKYLQSFTDRFDKYIEIFENPSHKEFLDSASGGLSHDSKGKVVRFFLDMKKRKVYVWNPLTYHIDASKEIYKDSEAMYKYAIPGTAALKGGKWVMVGSDELDTENYFWGYFGHRDMPRRFMFKDIGKNIEKGDYSDFAWVKSINVKPFFDNLFGR